MYPSEHKTITDSLDSAYSCFMKVFQDTNEISLVVAADVLIINKYPLDKHNIIVKEFTSFISEKGIVSVIIFFWGRKEDVSYKNTIKESFKKVNILNTN